MAVFTQDYDYQAEAIITTCAITPAVELDENFTVPQIHRTENAMWDTGATNCLISRKLIEALHLEPIGQCNLSDASSEEDEVADVYLVHLGLPTGHIVRNVQAAFTPSRDYDFVIGMDVITQGDFAITNKDNQTVFSYQRPAQEHIRFEER